MRNCLRLLGLSALTAVLSTTAAVQQIPTSLPVTSTRNELSKQNALGCKYAEAMVERPGATRVINKTRAEGEMCAVTVNVPYNDAEYMSGMGFIVTTDGSYVDFLIEMEEGVFWMDVPSGTYDILLDFRKFSTPGIFSLTAENIEVSGDTELTLNLDDCTNHIVFEAVLPNGEAPLSHLYDDDGNVYHAGNVYSAQAYTMLNHRSGECLSTQALNYDVTMEGNTLIDRGVNGDVWINNTTAFNVSQTKAFTTKEGNVLVCIPGTPTTTQSETYKAVASDYLKVETNFAQVDNSFEGDNVNYRSWPVNVIGYRRVVANRSIGESLYTSATLEYREWNSEVYYVANLGDLSSTFILPALSSKNCGVQTPNSLVGAFGIDCPPVYAKKGEPVRFMGYHPNSVGYNYDKSFDYLDMAFAFPVRWPMYNNQNYAFAADTEGLLFGEGCPSTLLLRMGTTVCYDFIGRYGENLTVDLLNSSLDVKYKGKTVCNEFLDMSAFNMSSEARKRGNWDITIDNQNVKVAGRTGRNYTEVHFDNVGDETSTPVLIQFTGRDKDNNITSRFESAAAANLAFSGGSFEYCYGENYKQGWVCSDLKSISVEYAPYGTENWQPLEVEQVADKFFMPGYGNWYQCSLSSLDSKGEQGWFDVRIMMEDHNKNTMKQTISPAFLVGEDTGVQGVSNDQNVYEVSRFAIDGRPIPSREKGLNIIRMSDGSTRKVIIK